MADSFYLPYLLVLFVLPMLAQWRWGLMATLIVTAVELMLVGLVFYAMASYHMLPDMHAGVPGKEPEHPFATMRRGQAAGYAQLFIFGVAPAVAALVGGGLAVVWSIGSAIWRAIANRARQQSG